MTTTLQKISQMDMEEKWWKSKTQNILALATWMMAFVIILLLFFVAIPPNNKEILNIFLGIIIGATVSPVYGYMFGKSKAEPIESGTSQTTTAVTETRTDNAK